MQKWKCEKGGKKWVNKLGIHGWISYRPIYFFIFVRGNNLLPPQEKISYPQKIFDFFFLRMVQFCCVKKWNSPENPACRSMQHDSWDVHFLVTEAFCGSYRFMILYSFIWCMPLIPFNYLFTRWKYLFLRHEWPPGHTRATEVKEINKTIIPETRQKTWAPWIQK